MDKKENKKDELNVLPPKEIRHLTKLDILRKLSPGTGLRDGLNGILRGSMGALIVVGNPNSLNVSEGGFKVNCTFSPKRLTELAKMDGAIILSEDFKKILSANALLVPDRTIGTSETGARHQAAERTAKQIGGLVIAVSERKREITVYYGNLRYVLQNTEDLLRRATETLRILEKQREVFDELLANLNVLEVTNLVFITDVCAILQRMEIIKKMTDIINEYVVELGREGVIVRMRMREVSKGIEREQELIIKDYIQKPAKIRNFFDNLSFEGLLDVENLTKFLFGKLSETKIIPKGYRLLSKTNLSNEEIDSLIINFKNFDGLVNADEYKLKRILKERAEDFQKEFVKLREQIMIGKKI